MNTKFLYAGALVVAGLVGGLGMMLEPAQANNEGQTVAIRTAVINVPKVFREYAKFKNLMEAFKADVEAKDNELRSMDTIRKSKAEQLRSIKNQADRDRIEKEIRDMEFEMAKKQQKYKNDFMQREADIHSSIYKEMTDLLNAYCEQERIHLVLRLTINDQDSNNPQAVFQSINRDVVYHHPYLDVTDVIIKALNQRQP